MKFRPVEAVTGLALIIDGLFLFLTVGAWSPILAMRWLRFVWRKVKT